MKVRRMLFGQRYTDRLKAEVKTVEGWRRPRRVLARSSSESASDVMPPWHVLIHTPHFGLGAVAGATLGGFLAWPQAVYTNLNTGHLVEYHNRLGLTSLDSDAAWTTLFFVMVFGACVGALVGSILVSMGVLHEEDLKIE